MLDTASDIAAYKDSLHGCRFCLDCAEEWPFADNPLLPLTVVEVCDNPSALSCERCGDGLLVEEWEEWMDE
jgi:hypothetical protein